MLNVKNVLLSASVLISVSSNFAAEKTRSQFFKEFTERHEDAIKFAAFFCAGAIVNAAKNSFNEESAANKVLNFTENLSAGILFVNGRGVFVNAGSRVPNNPNLVAAKSGYITNFMPLVAFVLGAMSAPNFKEKPSNVE